MATPTRDPGAHRKRRRRRRQDKPALPAKLVLDNHVKGDVGILSNNLFADLFPHLQDGECLEEMLGLSARSRVRKLIKT